MAERLGFYFLISVTFRYKLAFNYRKGLLPWKNYLDIVVWMRRLGRVEDKSVGLQNRL